MNMALYMTMVYAAATNVVTDILSVFDAIGTWIIGAITDMMPIFYSADGGLTILGVLASASLAFGVIFLIVGIIQRFFHFRG